MAAERATEGENMSAGKFAAIALGALLLAGCSGGGKDSPATGPTAPATAAPSATAGAQAAGDFDCTSIAGPQMVQFIVWTQLFAQVRTVDGLQTMSSLQYDPQAMSATLDLVDGLKGVKGPIYGTPDNALVLMRSANDTYAAIIKKGDAATDADFAPLNGLAKDTTDWINAQAAITTALNTACPDLKLS